VAINDKKGHFVRPASVFRDVISADSDKGFTPDANRYHIYVSYACPWACRALIFLTLKGLHDVISYSVVAPYMTDQGWHFGSESENTHDQLYGLEYLRDIYLKAAPDATSKVTVPVLWDKQTKTIVNNESAEVIRMLNTAFNDIAKDTTDYYPEHLRAAIDEINEFVYHNINNGVYRTGFATTQEAYEDAFARLFKALDEIELLLSKNRYLAGDTLTEADWRLFTTLIRFDCVYVGHFKCNLRRIDDYPHISNYLRELYQVPGIKETVRFDHIKEHYYLSHVAINPTQIVPVGPAVDYDSPHNRR